MNRKHIGERAPGDLNAWRKDKCRCYTCSGAWGRYQKQRLGPGWQALVDAEPVREHIAYLRASRIPLREIARRSGVALSTIGAIRGGSRNRPRTTRVRPEIAQRILAVLPSTAASGSSGFIDGVGTWRRLQALNALGFPRIFLAQRLGSHQGYMHLERPTMVRATFADAVLRLYNELWDADPAAYGLRPSAITAARKRAAAAGWPPPLGWDDDEIDNPRAEPRTGEPDSSAAARRAEELLAEAQFIAPRPLALAEVPVRAEIAARLEITPGYLDKLLAKAAA